MQHIYESTFFFRRHFLQSEKKYPQDKKKGWRPEGYYTIGLNWGLRRQLILIILQNSYVLSSRSACMLPTCLRFCRPQLHALIQHTPERTPNRRMIEHQIKHQIKVFSGVLYFAPCHASAAGWHLTRTARSSQSQHVAPAPVPVFTVGPTCSPNICLDVSPWTKYPQHGII